MEMTSNGRQPQNNKSGISQQPLIRSYPNFKVNLRSPNQILQIQMTYNGQQPQNIKMEYHSIHLLDHTQMLNLS